MKKGCITASRRRCAILDIQRLSRGFLARKRADERRNELVSRVQASSTTKHKIHIDFAQIRYQHSVKSNELSTLVVPPIEYMNESGDR